MSIYGDCHQLSPIGMKAISEDGPSAKPNYACAIGHLVLNDYIVPATEGVKSVVLVMDDVLWQCNPDFLSVIDKI